MFFIPFPLLAHEFTLRLIEKNAKHLHVVVNDAQFVRHFLEKFRGTSYLPVNAAARRSTKERIPSSAS